MQDFLDLQGASGAIYRFRLWPAGRPHRAVAGNYVVAQVTDDGLKVVFAGTSADLSTVRTSGRAAQRGERYVFTRLNVARERRAAEHADIVAHHRPPTSATEDS